MSRFSTDKLWMFTSTYKLSLLFLPRLPREKMQFYPIKQWQKSVTSGKLQEIPQNITFEITHKFSPEATCIAIIQKVYFWEVLLPCFQKRKYIRSEQEVFSGSVTILG